MSTYTVDRPLSFTSYKCFYTDCIPPPDPNTIPPAESRPQNFEYWDDLTLWNNSVDDNYVSNHGGSYGIPQDYDNVRIAYGIMHIKLITCFLFDCDIVVVISFNYDAVFLSIVSI